MSSYTIWTSSCWDSVFLFSVHPQMSVWSCFSQIPAYLLTPSFCLSLSLTLFLNFFSICFSPKIIHLSIWNQFPKFLINVLNVILQAFIIFSPIFPLSFHHIFIILNFQWQWCILLYLSVNFIDWHVKGLANLIFDILDHLLLKIFHNSFIVLLSSCDTMVNLVVKYTGETAVLLSGLKVKWN